MERVCVFIDGSNFYYGLKSLNLNNKKLDFFKLGELLAGKKRKLVRVYYYNAPLDQAMNKEKYKAQQRFFEELKKTRKVSVILCRMQKRKIDEKIIYAVKEDDIRIAVDMLRYAYNNAYDTAILVSGDGDFVPAVTAVQELGKSVEHAYFKIGHSYHLKQTCDDSFLLDEKFIKKCLKK